MQKIPFAFILVLLFCSLEASAFLVADGFDTGIDSTLYTNVSRVGTLNLSVVGGKLHFYGNLSTQDNPTYILTKDYLKPNESGEFSIDIEAGTCGGASSHLFAGLGNHLADTNYYGIFVQQLDASCHWKLTNVSSVLCSNEVLFENSGTHHVDVKITRPLNTSTQFMVYVDGVFRCNQTIQRNLNISALVKDESLGSSPIHTGDFDNLYFTDYNFSADCPDLSPTSIFHDDFSYYFDVSVCGWFSNPDLRPNLKPSLGRLCINSSGDTSQSTFSDLGFRGRNDYQNELTIQADMYVKSNTQGQLFYYVVNNQSADSQIAIGLIFNSINGNLYNYINETTQTTICTNCVVPDATNPIYITIFGKNHAATGYYDKYQDQFFPILPNTYQIRIGENQSYNLSMNQAAYGTDQKPDSFGLTVFNGQACIDNFDLSSNHQWIPVENYSTIPHLNVGEACENNQMCYTGLCSYGKCALKAYSADCNSSTECLSGVCSYGKCTKPTLLQGVTSLKNDLVGDDQGSGTIISLLISIALCILVAVVVGKFLKNSPVPALGALVIFVVVFTFFGIIGWVYPFLLIATWILVALSGMAVFILNRG